MLICGNNILDDFIRHETGVGVEGKEPFRKARQSPTRLWMIPQFSDDLCASTWWSGRGRRFGIYASPTVHKSALHNFPIIFARRRNWIVSMNQFAEMERKEMSCLRAGTQAIGRWPARKHFKVMTWREWHSMSQLCHLLQLFKRSRSPQQQSAVPIKRSPFESCAHKHRH